MSGNDWWNRNVFSCRQKKETDGADCTWSGRVFQKMEAATGNKQRPAVDRRYCGMCSCNGWRHRLGYKITNRKLHLRYQMVMLGCREYTALSGVSLACAMLFTIISLDISLENTDTRWQRVFHQVWRTKIQLVCEELATSQSATRSPL